jgi:hypothetical protein
MKSALYTIPKLCYTWHMTQITVQATPSLKATYPGSIALNWDSRFVEELMQMSGLDLELSDFLFSASEGDESIVATVQGDAYVIVGYANVSSR